MSRLCNNEKAYSDEGVVVATLPDGRTINLHIDHRGPQAEGPFFDPDAMCLVEATARQFQSDLARTDRRSTVLFAGACWRCQGSVRGSLSVEDAIIA